MLFLKRFLLGTYFIYQNTPKIGRYISKYKYILPTFKLSKYVRYVIFNKSKYVKI